MKSLQDILKDSVGALSDLTQRHKYVTTEFQDYGYRLAMKLDEKERASLFIKLAKTKPRALLEQAYSFAIDYPNAKHRGRIFLWRLKNLEDEYKENKQNAQLDLFGGEKPESQKKDKRKKMKDNEPIE